MFFDCYFLILIYILENEIQKTDHMDAIHFDLLIADGNFYGL